MESSSACRVSDVSCWGMSTCDRSLLITALSTISNASSLKWTYDSVSTVNWLDYTLSTAACSSEFDRAICYDCSCSTLLVVVKCDPCYKRMFGTFTNTPDAAR